MLTRVYGTAFFSPKELAEHLERLEQARARDHRKLGRELDLFSFSRAQPGLAVLASGAARRSGMRSRELWREQNSARGYQEVHTPILYDVELWKQSGHWDKYRDHMYFTDVEGRQMGLKPMNCPAHIQIYNVAPALAPRPADPACRAGTRPPPRAQRDAARPAARAEHHPGRRAHLLHR